MIATIILLVLICIDLGCKLALHKQQRVKTYNFWVTLFADSILVYLYYSAGLFDNFK